ncbi:Cytochrome b2, mitochondrial precursor [Claviceps maximensis]|nr:Cytochrome b2, mitochondrial precursor [Claviceps maximensis]
MALKGSDIEKHNDEKSCWVIVHGKAYDVTDFLPEHPGGSKIILKYAGKDATEEFEPIHPPDTLDKYLDKSKHLGDVDMGTVAREDKAEDPEEAARVERVEQKPLLSQCYNLFDFEAVARRIMKRTAWGYYSSAADDEITMRENHNAFHRIWFRPRVLVDVEKVDCSTTMLGTKCSVPLYVTATALGKLGNPEGEVVLTRAAHTHDVIQMIPTLASCSFDEIVDARRGDQVQWLQLYVNKDRDITRRIVRHAQERGCKGLFITVDAPQLGRREKDMRSKFTAEQGSSVQSGHETDTSQGAARAISSFIDPSLSWKDIAWFKSITSMPIILKGVQRVEDVLRAIQVGAHGVVLSNHGGRQLDTARSGIEILAETMPVLRARGLDHRIEVFVDGGIRRATDIIKALCLGARGVGIGRPFLYAMSAYGQPGVERAMQLLKDEMEMNMRLIGCASVRDLNPSLVDTSALFVHSGPVAVDALSQAVYDPLVTPAQRTSTRAKL